MSGSEVFDTYVDGVINEVTDVTGVGLSLMRVCTCLYGLYVRV